MSWSVFGLFPFFSGTLRGKLCWFKIGLWLLGLGSDLFFSGSHLSFYYFLRSGTQTSDAGTRVKRTVMMKETMQSQFYLFVCFLESHLKLKVELNRGWMRLHVNLSCFPLVTTLTQIDSIYSDSCAQLAVAPLDWRDLLWFSFWKNDSSRYAEKWINSPVANDFYTVH